MRAFENGRTIEGQIWVEQGLLQPGTSVDEQWMQQEGAEPITLESLILDQAALGVRALIWSVKQISLGRIDFDRQGK